MLNANFSKLILFNRNLLVPLFLNKYLWCYEIYCYFLVFPQYSIINNNRQNQWRTDYWSWSRRLYKYADDLFRSLKKGICVNQLFEYLSKNKNTDYRMCVAWLLAVEPVIVKHNAWATVAVLRSTRWANGMRGEEKQQ